MDDLPGIENAPAPYLPPAVLERKSRFRFADDLEAIIRQNHKQGISRFFITDDNIARNRHWEEFFDRIIELRYYTPEHIETVARRNGSVKGRRIAIEPACFMTLFRMIFEVECVHPLEGGLVHLKYRRDRRHGMPIEPIGVFHWKLAQESVRKLRIYGHFILQVLRIARRVVKDPRRHEYMDLALTPVDDEDMDKLSLFHETVAKLRGEDLARAELLAAQDRRLAAVE